MLFFKRYYVTVLAILGFVDASYLTYKHFFDRNIICYTGPFSDCGAVLNSSYSQFLGIPVALFGVLHYLAVIYFYINANSFNTVIYKRFLFIQTFAGLILSVFFTYLQFFVIKAICPYCLLSAVISFILYFAVRAVFKEDYKRFIRDKIGVLYALFLKPLLFLMPADFVHSQAMLWGEFLGKSKFIQGFFRSLLFFEERSLEVEVAGIKFANPIGLAAGYDYQASFTQILPSFGFGFETIGTITAQPCIGNTKPRLGRLPKSRSLLVNKGFRNPGVEQTIKKLKNLRFKFPLGVSVGQTNNDKTKDVEEAIKDIFLTFSILEKSMTEHSFYELNISCPNLKKSIDFYNPKNLEALLIALKKIRIKKPLFVKMPIDLSNSEISAILAVLSRHRFLSGVIFGNLKKDRSDTSFDKDEILKAGKGNFSGYPTYRRSNELIKMTYQNYNKRFIIIGCGGVFTATDAYEKIKNGASLVQMITGMIFEGPQVVSTINEDLCMLLRKDGFTSIKEAVGANVEGFKK